MTEQRTVAPTEDPVCGMTVDPTQAREKGLTLIHEARSTPSAARAAYSSSATSPASIWTRPTRLRCSGQAPPAGFDKS